MEGEIFRGVRQARLRGIFHPLNTLQARLFLGCIDNTAWCDHFRGEERLGVVVDVLRWISDEDGTDGYFQVLLADFFSLFMIKGIHFPSVSAQRALIYRLGGALRFVLILPPVGNLPEMQKQERNRSLGRLEQAGRKNPRAMRVLLREGEREWERRKEGFEISFSGSCSLFGRPLKLLLCSELCRAEL